MLIVLLRRDAEPRAGGMSTKGGCLGERARTNPSAEAFLCPAPNGATVVRNRMQLCALDQHDADSDGSFGLHLQSCASNLDHCGNFPSIALGWMAG